MDGATNSEQQVLLQQLNEAKRKIGLIGRITFELNKVLHLNAKLHNILKILHDEFYINHSMILLPDANVQKLVVQSSYGYDTQKEGYEVSIGSGLTGLAALKRIPINITGMRRKRQYFSTGITASSDRAPELPGLTDPESQIAIPLISNSELVAVLMAESYKSSVFSKDDELFLITLSQSIAVSIQNSLLFDNMEGLIARRTEELRKSNHTKDRLFSIISHDLRGPVSSFHTIGKMVRHYNKRDEKEKLEQLSVKIDHSVSKLNLLLDNLLSWAMTQTGEMQHNACNVNIITLLNENIELLKEQARQKQIQLNTCAEDSYIISADPHMVSAILRNIISNAIKYTPVNGEISANVARVDDYIAITIADNGVGITPERLATIFEANENKSTTGTANEKGTGLGLLVAKEFSEMSHGVISIESAPSQGTKVVISLPVAG